MKASILPVVLSSLLLWATDCNGSSPSETGTSGGLSGTAAGAASTGSGSGTGPGSTSAGQNTTGAASGTGSASGGSSSGGASGTGSAAGSGTASAGASTGQPASSGTSGGTSAGITTGTGTSSGGQGSGATGSTGGSTSGGSDDGGAACDPACADKLSCCGTSCVDLTGDSFNCGACGDLCAPGDYCSGSACVAATCPTGGCNGDGCCGAQCCGADQVCCPDNGPIGGLFLCEDADAGSCPIGCAPMCVSRRAAKRDIEYLDEAQLRSAEAQVLKIPLARFNYKWDGPTERRRLGFIIDDVAPSPGVIDEARGEVDLYGYTSLAVAALQEQGKEIARLRKQVDELQKRLDHRR